MRAGVLSPDSVLADGRIDLPDVTLVAVSSIALDLTVAALQRSMQECRFGQVLLFSDRVPGGEDMAGITWRQITPLASRDAYSHFMLRELHRHVATGFALCVQWDGYVLDRGGWRDSFLDYDYIGAPWPHFSDGHTVGNGGFSLRSRRLMAICADQPDYPSAAEDVTICRIWRPRLEQDFGLRFAPEAEARQFAFERHAARGGEFGFHSAFNLVRLLPEPEMAGILRALELNVLTSLEHRELLRWSLLRGRLRLAWIITRRMVRRRNERARRK